VGLVTLVAVCTNPVAQEAETPGPEGDVSIEFVFRGGLTSADAETQNLDTLNFEGLTSEHFAEAMPSMHAFGSGDSPGTKQMHAETFLAPMTSDDRQSYLKAAGVVGIQSPPNNDHPNHISTELCNSLRQPALFVAPSPVAVQICPCKPLAIISPPG
jgi:hypothetical protein